MTLGEKIQKLRKQRGLSQEALAEKVTVTRQTISKWELGQSLPDLDFIAQLSDIFNVSSDYLIKDEMTEPNELPYKKRNYRLSERGKRIILVIVSAAALIAGCVCLICDCFTSDRLSWSLIAAVSIIAAWLMIATGIACRSLPSLSYNITKSDFMCVLLYLLTLSSTIARRTRVCAGPCESRQRIARTNTRRPVIREVQEMPGCPGVVHSSE